MRNLKINNVVVENVLVNGTQVEVVNCNGTKVWQNQIPIIENGVLASGFSATNYVYDAVNKRASMDFLNIPTLNNTDVVIDMQYDQTIQFEGNAYVYFYLNDTSTGGAQANTGTARQTVRGAINQPTNKFRILPSGVDDSKKAYIYSIYYIPR